LFAETADDKIKQLVEGSKKSRGMVVISNDKELKMPHKIK
jgi:rRNA-processing protein FCF1